MGLDTGFLELLSHTANWQAYTGEDTWGNNTYGVGIIIKTFILSEDNNEAPSESQDRQHVQNTTRWELIADGLGIKVRDRMVINGVTGYVTAVTTNRDDESTNPLYQEVTVTTEEEQ